MLAIRPDQMELFRRQAQERQELRLVRHFQKFYPRECREAGEPNVQKIVHAGIEKAAAHGYLTLQQAGFTVGLMFMLGVDFDVDPQIPWAAERIRDPKIADPDRRIQAAYGAAVEFLGKTAGSECESVVKAMVRLRAWDLKSPAPGTATWEAETCAMLGRFYPEKLAAQGEASTRALLRKAAPEAARYGIRGAPGLGLYAVLMFMLGSGYDHDPLYPWASRVLSTPAALLGEAARVSSLHREALSHVATSLSSK